MLSGDSTTHSFEQNSNFEGCKLTLSIHPASLTNISLGFQMNLRVGPHLSESANSSQSQQPVKGTPRKPVWSSVVHTCNPSTGRVIQEDC